MVDNVKLLIVSIVILDGQVYENKMLMLIV